VLRVLIDEFDEAMALMGRPRVQDFERAGVIRN
jgi:isopentenyl diphosphate isomerase/L-lactate dehydrogenase-like FMN-dependent dehydrogenase